MPTNSQDAPRPLPDRPNLRHLRDQAKDLLEAGEAKSLTDAQFRIARLYGFASWPKLKAHVESVEIVAQLKRAIDTNDVERVKALMTRNPELHKAPLGYGKDGPLTWVAECRVPWEPPGEERLAMAKWMIENGSDVHQGGDGPLGRAALNSDRVAMMELLVAHGADVNAGWHGNFPILFGPCESLDPESLRWLLDHGADPNCGMPEDWISKGLAFPGTALDYLFGTYLRDSEAFRACLEMLLERGGTTKYNSPAVLAILRGRLDNLKEQLDLDPTLVARQFPELDFGVTAARMLTLRGATLLHVAAEFGNVEAARLLLDRGADANARAAVDDGGVGGQTPIFHAATQREDQGLEVIRLLVERGADLSVRAKLPGYYERLDEVVECTPFGYSLLFPGHENETTALLRSLRAPE
jgi:ankyrin repeat protein